MRLDRWLVEAGQFPSRTRAQAAIAAGLVTVDGQTASRPAVAVHEGMKVTVTGDPIGYVGRGGLKLAAALAHFGLTPAGVDVLDAGASTGGFTDCLLQHGARRVAAVDVGHGQLHPALVADDRVWDLSGTDIRRLAPATLVAQWGSLPPLAVADVSFIGLRHVLPALLRLTAPAAELLVLVKPQFEVGPAGVGKGGLVRNPEARQRAVATVLHAARDLGLLASDPWPCPVLGADGSRETFLYLQKVAPAEAGAPGGVS